MSLVPKSHGAIISLWGESLLLFTHVKRENRNLSKHTRKTWEKHVDIRQQPHTVSRIRYTELQPKSCECRLWICLNSMGFRLLSVLLLSSEESIYNDVPLCLAGILLKVVAVFKVEMPRQLVWFSPRSGCYFHEQFHEEIEKFNDSSIFQNKVFRPIW